jgi:thiol-disulfide isomerase/thioredoxin
MRKYFSVFIAVLASFLMFSCSSQKTITQLPTEEMIVGEFSESNLKENNYATWYLPEYNEYIVETKKLNDVKGAINDFEIETFMGTWCGDSKREVPRLYKILEAVDYPTNKMKIYGVNRQKKSIKEEEVGKSISHVPTIIFYKDGKEIGRIVESPVTGYLEEDIAMIVKGTPLTPNYAEN